MATVDRSYTICYSSAIVSIALTCTIFELFDIEEYHDLEIYIKCTLLNVTGNGTFDR